jgi:hypothetical protein
LTSHWDHGLLLSYRAGAQSVFRISLAYHRNLTLAQAPDYGKMLPERIERLRATADSRVNKGRNNVRGSLR